MKCGVLESGCRRYRCRRWRSRGRIDTADIDVGIFIVEIAGHRGGVALKGDPRGQPGEIVDAAQTLDIEFLLSEGRGTDGHILQTLGTASRGHHDFLEAGGGRRRVAIGRPGVAEKRKATHQAKSDRRPPQRPSAPTPVRRHDVLPSRSPHTYGDVRSASTVEVAKHCTIEDANEHFLTIGLN